MEAEGGDVVLSPTGIFARYRRSRYRQHYRAENGQPGMGRGAHGRYGEDWSWSERAIGTVVADDATGEVLADLTSRWSSRSPGARRTQEDSGQRSLQESAVTSKAPRRMPRAGPRCGLRCRLPRSSSAADVGLVRVFQMRAKSALVSRTERSEAERSPAASLSRRSHRNLGSLRTGPDRSFVLADIPGLIEGRARPTGRGLGRSVSSGMLEGAMFRERPHCFV